MHDCSLRVSVIALHANLLAILQVVEINLLQKVQPRL